MPPKRNAQPEPQTDICPLCRGPMPSPVQIIKLQDNGIPLSVDVCHHCHDRLVPRVNTYPSIKKVKVTK